MLSTFDGLKTRAQSALLILGALAVSLFLFQEKGLYLIFSLVLALGIKELFFLQPTSKTFFAITLALAPLIFFYPKILILLLPSSALIFSKTLKDDFNLKPLTSHLFAKTVFVCFTVTVLTHFNLLYNYGPWFFISLQILASLADTLAYFSGKIFKGPKAPIPASAHKTFSGFFGTLILTPIFYQVFCNKLPQLICFSFSHIFLLTLAAIWGDLIFSAIKRLYSVKDFSNLIPGHGGVLDRVDSLVGVTILFVLLNSFHIIS